MLKNRYPDFPSYEKGFLADEAFLSEFFAYADKEGVKKDEKGWEASQELIVSQLRGLVAQKLWDMTELYTIINQYDKEVQKALEVIQDKEVYRKLGIDD